MTPCSVFDATANLLQKSDIVFCAFGFPFFYIPSSKNSVLLALAILPYQYKAHKAFVAGDPIVKTDMKARQTSSLSVFGLH